MNSIEDKEIQKFAEEILLDKTKTKLNARAIILMSMLGIALIIKYIELSIQTKVEKQ